MHNRDEYDDLVERALSRVDRRDAATNSIREPASAKPKRGERFYGLLRPTKLKVGIGLILAGLISFGSGTKICCDHVTRLEQQLSQGVDDAIGGKSERRVVASDQHEGYSLNTGAYLGFGGATLSGLGLALLTTRFRERHDYMGKEKEHRSVADKDAIRRREYT